MDELTGLKTLVTGGASGIGLAIATLFAAEGATVVVLDLSPEHPCALPAELGT
jgi:NAD(P)-dependent dehydrogenase (short-subunit alcohol dehydrogenase family)